MAGKLSVDGLKQILGVGIGSAALQTKVIRLFQNDHNPAEGDDLGDYEECDFGGYEEVPLLEWTAPVHTGGLVRVQSESAAFVAASPSASQTVYGYYLIFNDGEEKLFLAERFADGPYTVNATGDTITVLPRVTLDNVA